LKPLITNTRISIEEKGVSMDMGENRANFLLLTNYVDAMPLTDNDRRYAPLLTAQQNAADLQRDGLTNAFFVDFFAWLDKGGWSAVHHYLRHYPIAERYNPAGICRTAPNTTGREQVVAATRGETEELVVEAAESGLPGFASGWVSVTMLTLYLERLRLPRLNGSKRKQLLSKLGYEPHPAFQSGRAPRVVAPDNVRSTIYVKRDTPAAQLDAADACAHYERAQSAPLIAAAKFGSV